LAPITTSRSHSSTPSEVWQVCDPNIRPFTQKSPVFSCESALKNREPPIHVISDLPYAPPEWLPCPPPPT